MLSAPATSDRTDLPPEARGCDLRAAAQGALIESRQRWRDLVGLAADLAFETDADGRLAFLAPERVLGWPAAVLLGRRPAEEGWLVQPEPDPFTLTTPARDIRAWLRRSDGEACCLSFTVAPLSAPDGGFAGLRGIARDVTAEVQEAEAQAAALRRAVAVQALVRRVREAVLAPRMLPTLLDLLPAAIGCAGAAVIDLSADGHPAPMPSVGPAAARPPALPAAFTARPEQPVFSRGPSGEPLALVPQAGIASLTPIGGAPPAQALLVWREPGARPFDADERHLLEALSDLLGVVLGNQHLLSELERQARTDGMTGLLNRRAFLEDLRRRLDRACGEGSGGPGGGALLFLDVDNLKPVNDSMGHEAGDALLIAVAGLMRRTTRATDLAARLGGDEFALWLEGVTEASVARARAEALCGGAAAIALPAPGGEGRVPVGISLGIALACPGRVAETPEGLLARADAALYAAKRAGRNAWRLAPAA